MTTTAPKWSAKQDAALITAHRLYQAGEPVIRMFGFAGSGKTTLAKYLAEQIGGTVLYCAYTGKAAHVLGTKGCTGASTIHKLIYKPADKDKTELMRLKEELEGLEAELRKEQYDADAISAHPRVKQLREKLEVEKHKHKRPMFMLNPDSAVKDASLVIVDECSMVDAQVGRDLESYGTTLLVLGDPAQLPPVMGSGYFTAKTPHILLDEVHRQAADNPIIRMATDIREGRGLKRGVYKDHTGKYGDSRVIGFNEVDREELMASDQVLVGTNKRRHGTNARMRELLGRSSPMPEAGDKLVCLRNNHEIGLLNGGLWIVNAATLVDNDVVSLDLVGEDTGAKLTVESHTQYFQGGEPPFWSIKDYECFDYGNALTVHKSQGSQWDNVYTFDESRCFRADARKWLYTGVTRAANRIIVAQE